VNPDLKISGRSFDNQSPRSPFFVFIVMMAVQQVRCQIIGEQIERFDVSGGFDQNMPAVSILRFQIGQIDGMGIDPPASGRLIEDGQTKPGNEEPIQLFKNSFHFTSKNLG